MTFTACSLLLAVTLASSPESPASGLSTSDRIEQVATVMLREAPVRQFDVRTAKVEAWMLDAKPKRPAALPALYASLGVLQAFDVYSTRRALGTGAGEMNPLMKPAAGSSGAMLAVKAASTAASIYFSERAWKQNKKGAIVLMAVVNGVTAAAVAHNLRSARR